MALECTKTNLKKGSKGDNVREAQTILQKLGYYHGIIDGDYGDLTVDAVRKYQKSKNNLLADGILGPVTCKKLREETTPSSDSTIHGIKDITGHKFLKADIQRATSTMRQHIRNNKNYPNYLTIPDENGKKFNIGKTAYMGLFEDVSIFNIKNGRMPNYVVASHTANNPLVIDYQNTGYTCGPTSLSMCMQMFGLWVTEQQLSRECGTTKAGTGPSDLIRVSKKYGLRMYEIPRNIQAVRKAINEASPVFMHINTAYSGGRSCLGYYGEFGHYIMCYNVTGDKYNLADPTKGFKNCKSTGIDNAKSSSNMKYYRFDVL